MRLIDLDELEKHDHWKRIVMELSCAPTVDPIKHGKWEDNGFCCFCSVCGEEARLDDIEWINDEKHGLAKKFSPSKTPFCHNCGAKMDGK